MASKKKAAVVVSSSAAVVPPQAASPLTAGAISLAALQQQQLVLHREYECRVCHCRSQSKTSCGICKRRNCMDEVLVGPVPGAAGSNSDTPTEAEAKRRGSLAQAIAEGAKILRRKTGILKFDKVLGGGYVDKAAILIAGDPGAGKSTLLLQACVAFAGPVKKPKPKAKKGKATKGKPKKDVKKLAEATGVPVEEVEPEVHRTLYCSGEEAFEQVGARAGRIVGALEKGPWIEFVSTRNVPDIMGAILDVKPHLVVIDSIQEVGDEALQGRFGGENQAANAVRSVMKCIRENGFGTAIFVCHVRKDGDIAGAKKAEHLVDVVMKLSIALRDAEDEDEADLPEDEKTVHDERYLEAYKNRYGAVTERAIFTMTAAGLR